MNSKNPAVSAKTRAQRLVRILGAGISLTLLAGALVFLYRDLHGLDLARLQASVISTGTASFGLALLFTMLSYLMLTGYDVAAVRYTQRSIPYRMTGLISFIAFAVGMNVGFSALSGGAIRYRLYSALGVTASDIARIVLFATVTFTLGTTLLIGAAFLFSEAGHDVLGLPEEASRAIGIALLAVPILYLAVSFSGRAKVRFGFWELSVPGPGIAVAQIVLASADLMFASAVLYVLVETVIGVSYPTFLAIYLVAMVAGLLSSVPGGIGVFEAVLIAALPHTDSASLLASILLYRFVYYIVPLVLAVSAFGWQEARHYGESLRRVAERSVTPLLSAAPILAAAATFLAGAVLTLSGVLPAVESRMHLIADAIPMAILELSHLAGSVFGLCLLILAHGLYRRLRSAYAVTVALLAAGAVASLLKGLRYEEALLMVSILLLLWFSRKEFYRSGSIGGDRLTLTWVIAVATVLGVGAWIGIFSYRHVEYSDLLWWQFSADADASRFLRTGLVVGVAVLGFAVFRLLRSEKEPAFDEEAVDYEKVRLVIDSSSESTANVALLGDKRFLWSEDGSAFVMYQVSGRSWIAMGPPVGEESAIEEVAWRFLEMVDRHDGRPVFYQVGADFLPICIDMGLSMSKLGEDARVDLALFSLEGSVRAELRQAVNRAKRENAVFEIVPQAQVPGIMGELKRISDNWLDDKTTGEKGFSLGAFHEDYLAKFDCAVVRVNGEIVAFANLWLTANHQEASIDLMRYSDDAPKGIMDYLFVELMLWSKAQGYRWFSLGMAPLSGLEERPLAPLWHRIGTLVFRHGENFYNFEGLRRYKDKFLPEWDSKYLACPSGPFHLAAALFDASVLIAEGANRDEGRDPDAGSVKV